MDDQAPKNKKPKFDNITPGKKEKEDDGYRVLAEYISKFKKFGMDQHICKIVISSLGEDPEQRLGEIIEKRVDLAYKNCQKDGREPSKFGLLIDGEGLEYPILIPVRDRLQNSTDVILNTLDKLEISGKKLPLLNNQLTLTITTLSLPKGSGNAIDYRKLFGVNEKARLRAYNLTNNYCLFYSLELARLYHDQTEIYQRKKSGQSFANLITAGTFARICASSSRQYQFAIELMENTNIPKYLDSYGIEWLPQVQHYYNQRFPGMYRIVAIDDSIDVKPLWRGPLGQKYEVVIYLEAGHWDGLKSIASYFKMRKYCVGVLL